MVSPDQPLNTRVIAQQWDELLRVAGSLILGTVSATELMQALQRGNRYTTLARGIGEVGKVAKALFLLNYMDDPQYRRRILTQLNRGEGRHKLARLIFYSQRGELRQKYRQGQEDQLGTLRLVVNVVVLWNTRYMDAALTYLGQQGMPILAADVARLSPLGSSHLTVLGRYHFMVPEAVGRGELRPLRRESDGD